MKDGVCTKCFLTRRNWVTLSNEGRVQWYRNSGKQLAVKKQHLNMQRQSSYKNPGHFPQRNEDLCSHRNLYTHTHTHTHKHTTHTHSSFICNKSKLETTWMPFNGETNCGISILWNATQ